VADCWDEHNESSGSMKGGEFLDQLSEYQFLKKDSPLWSYVTQDFS
jgi:hypothetical protein